MYEVMSFQGSSKRAGGQGPRPEGYECKFSEEVENPVGLYRICLVD